MITLPSSEYSVGWICALPLELTAARAMLDIEHGKPADQDPNDSNTYCLGSIGSYNIVIACLPVGAYGLVSTAVVGTKMLQTFKSLEYGLMVGIGGGVPSEEVDVRLGDVVVSKPGKGSGGVIQFDFGKEYGNGLFERVGSLNRPPEALLTALAFLETDYLIRGNRIPDLLDTAYARFPTLVPHFRYQGHATDLLFAADYDHLDTKLSCEKCKCAKLVARPLRTDSCPRVFQGLIASGNQVMKHAPTRDRLGNELGVICFEMEAAALMNILPSLVIRGICDYADSHKSKRWQPYAAMTAAAFASDLIRVLPKKSEQVALRTLEMPHANENWETRLKTSMASVDPHDFLQIFSLVPRETHMPSSPMDPPNPELYWVLKNVDYLLWNKPRTRMSNLCLSAQDHNQLDRVVSCILDTHATKKPEDVMVKFSWTDLFNTISPYNFFLQTVFSVLLEQLSRDEAKTALLRFLRSILDHLTPDDKKALYDKRYPSMSKESFVQMIYTMLNLKSADLLTALMAALMYQDKSFIITIRGNETWDTFLISFVRNLTDKMKAFGEGAACFRILITGLTNTDLEERWTGLLHIQHDKERQDCLSSLLFDNMRYDRITESHADSLEWFWTHRQYTTWSTSTGSRLLYVEGKPGSGKSTLTKYVKDHLSQKISTDRSPIIAHFFYSHRDGERERRHQNMLRAILWNILNQDSSFFYHFQPEYRRVLAPSSQTTVPGWSYESLERTLLSITRHPDPKDIYLILDAIDESDETYRRNTVRFLLGICDLAGQCVFKVFMASRPTADLRLNLSKRQNFDFIQMQDETESDIRAFARSFLETDVHFSGKLLQEAIEYIVSTAQGVFLWVQLIRGELQLCVEKGYRKKEVFKTLFSLPTELETFYLHMLSNLSNRTEQEIVDARNMFQLVLFAERSLSVVEIQHMLAMEALLAEDMDVTLESFEDELIQAMETRIIHCGANFLEIKRDKYVQLIHQTVREFFLPAELSLQDTGPVARSRLRFEKEETVHARIVTICVRYMEISASPDYNGSVETWEEETFEEYAELLNNQPLIRYILSFLPHHLAKLPKDSEVTRLVNDMVSAFRGHAISYLLASWVEESMGEELPSLRQFSLQSTLKLKLLHIASRKDLVHTAEMVIFAGGDINNLLEQKFSLHVAAMHGSEKVLQLLLNHNAKPGVKYRFGRTPLHYAADSGHVGSVRILSEHLDIDDPDTNGCVPLHLAAQNGHLDVVDFLMNKGAKVHTRDNIEQWNALHWASHHGHISIIKYLLESESGFATDVTDRKGRTPLYVASANNQPQAVNILLQHRSDANIADKVGLTPLIVAAAAGHERVVQVFVDRQPAFALQTDTTAARTALSHAALRGHITVVRTLAAAQGDLDLRDGEGQTALHLATRANQIEIIHLLVSMGGNSNAQDFWDTTALHVAAYYGHIDTLNALIELGANVHITDTEGRDALHFAAGKGHTRIVQALLLLQHRSQDKPSTDARGWTPLFWAAGNGHVDILSLLLAAKNVDINAKDRNDVTCLHWAARKGHISTVQLLLDKGAKSHALDINGLSPHRWALEFQHGDVARLLLPEHASHAGEESKLRPNFSLSVWVMQNGYDEPMPQL